MAGFPTSENRLVADLKLHSITIMSNYRVFLNSYQGLPQNHHGIFVELKNDGSGCLYHVKGSIQLGMKYVSDPARSPLSSGSFHARKQISSVPASLYTKVDAICKTVPPPRKQYEGPKLLVPKNELRRCQEWTNEAIAKPKAEGVLQGNEGDWIPRTDLEDKPKGKGSSTTSAATSSKSSEKPPAPSSSKSSSSSSSKSSASSSSKTSALSSSKSSASSSSSSEPADGTMSTDGKWVYSKKAKNWYQKGQDGKVIWKKTK
jgi:hypothetical protein